LTIRSKTLIITRCPGSEAVVSDKDHQGGMGSSITRRDFLNGMAVTAGASLLPFGELLAQDQHAHPWALETFLAQGITPQDPRYYPPALTGLRGSHPGSFEVAHSLRDGQRWPTATADDDSYDLVVVGGGISGLASAYFFRKAAGAKAKILILDNHDDFGGHAKRNEFRAGDRLLLGYGGTQSIAEPGRYSKVASGLLNELGIDAHRFYKYYDQKLFPSMHLKSATFFDRETFGQDLLWPYVIVGYDETYSGGKTLPLGALTQMPIAQAACKDILRLQAESIDYFADLDANQTRAKLTKTSYKDFLLQFAKVHPDVVKVFQSSTHDLHCVGIDAVSALECRRMGYPGFKGVKPVALRRSGIDEGQGDEEPYIFHFPDGNASVARLLVRSLIPDSAPGRTMEDIVTAKMNYARLDDDRNPVRIRLNSTAVSAKHIGDPSTAKEVEITYLMGGQARRVRASNCVLACYNSVVPYLCPEMPQKQKEGLAYAVKQPLVYTNVQIRNWTSFQKLGVSYIYGPASYFSSTTLDFPVSLGDYKFPSSPDESCILHLVRTPCSPGLPCKEQFKAGRYELFMTPFETFERKIRDQLGRMLGGGGFDPAKDIQAITVNRWPHGYAYEYNELFEPLDQPDSERPCVIGRQPFGRISIANADSGGDAYTDIAIDQAYRAVQEALATHKAVVKGAREQHRSANA
jgi:spermidine dehydrogenase